MSRPMVHVSPSVFSGHSSSKAHSQTGLQKLVLFPLMMTGLVIEILK